MSEDVLNASIAAKWEAAGLDASNDGTEIPVENDGSESADDIDTETPADAEGDEADPDPDPAGEADPVADPDPAEGQDPVETPAAKTEEEKQAQHDAEDELAAALGLGKPPEDPKKRAQWWKTRVPYSQLHKVVTEREKKAKETFDAGLREYTDKISTYDTRFADVKKVEDLITNDAEQYVKTLAALFPDTYGKMFAPLLGDGTAAKLIVDETDPGPQPEPDLELPNDGGKTYSVEGYRKLMAWQQKVTEQNMLKRMKPHMDFIAQQQTAAQKAQKAQDAEEQRQRGIKAANDAVAEVKTWDLGAENINEIVKVAATLDARYDAETALNIAYRRVVVPKLKANRDEMLAQVLKDQKKASARQTAAGITQMKTATPTAAATGSLDDRIKAAAKRAGLKL